MLKATQIKYITERLERVVKAKNDLISDRYAKEVKSLIEQAFKKKDYVVVKEEKNYYRRSSLCDPFDFKVTFPKIEKTIEELQKSEDAEIRSVYVLAQTIKDKAMLGDQDDVFEALKAFESLTV